MAVAVCSRQYFCPYISGIDSYNFHSEIGNFAMHSTAEGEATLLLNVEPDDINSCLCLSFSYLIYGNQSEFGDIFILAQTTENIPNIVFSRSLGKKFPQ